MRKNDKAKDIGNRVQIASRQPKNLQKLVGGFREGSGGLNKIPPDAGCYRCSKKCKVSCPVLEERKDFTSFNTYKTYRQKLDCDSAWLIYLCSCKKCGGQYVGKSKTPFKKKALIEEVEFKTMEFLAKRELFWQHQLRVYVENGSNGH